MDQHQSSSAAIFSLLCTRAPKYQHRVLFWGSSRGTPLCLLGIDLPRLELILRYQVGSSSSSARSLLLAASDGQPHQRVGGQPEPRARWRERLFPTVDFYDGRQLFTRRTLKP